MSAKHTPGPWKAHFEEAYFVTGPDLGRVAMMMNLKGAHGLGGRRTGEESAANARLIAASPELKALAANFEITGPDADGVVWLVLHGNGTTGKAMFSLGPASRLAVQVALKLEEDRRAAIAKATGSAA